MLFNNLLIAAVATLAHMSLVFANAVPYERLEKNNTVLLIVDHQVGLYSLARDFEPAQFFRQTVAHAALGKLFDIPVIITASMATGPNGPIPDEILDLYPDVPVIQRQGEINAWDNPDVKKAIKDTGRTQFIIAGLATDVCTTQLALSLRAEGYSVWANVEASGTTSALIRDVTNSRLQFAGVQLVGISAILTELFRDWRSSSPNAAEFSAWMVKFIPELTWSSRLFEAAKNSTAA
ncbi:ycaC [Fusarium pseudocircinatum]|uniref:YcaC n=1 Tax=Fusarium pseudocircinatum TaxID=56676 RepID=A0A8H5PWB0_9HYPO|nr:ycaC [Fusarium pseudocircinatum]